MIQTQGLENDTQLLSVCGTTESTTVLLRTGNPGGGSHVLYEWQSLP